MAGELDAFSTAQKQAVHIKELFPIPTQNYTPKGTLSVRQKVKLADEIIETAEEDQEIMDTTKIVFNQNLIKPMTAPMSNTALSKFGVTSPKVSRPMTAFYSNAGTIRSGVAGGFLKNNAPISNGTYGQTVTSAFHKKQSTIVPSSQQQEDDEAEIVESQIDWFERSRLDLKKKNRYANSNLHEVFNYEEKLAKHLEEKREKKN